MTDDRQPTREFVFPAGDEETDVRWLAGLIRALRKQVDESSYPEVSAILDAAQRAAQAAAERARASKSH